MKSRKRSERIQQLLNKARSERLKRFYDTGHSLGQKWAVLPENIEGVIRLNRLFDKCDIDDWHCWFESSERNRKIKFIEFALILNPEWKKHGNWVEAEIWQCQLADEAQCNVRHPIFMRGFAEGAIFVSKETNAQ
tara:strand:+ start:242 stop:646 length:405 start_codon:yes stop_codon:yes gene_type:complete